MRKNLVTQQGYNKLFTRLETLKREDRRKVSEEIEIAREHGDLSENAEYIYAKEKQGQIEAKIAEIESFLSNSEIVTSNMISKNGNVVFGAWVTVLNQETDEKKTYKIVGQPESNPYQGRLNYETPFARALIGKRAGDEIEFVTPKGDEQYWEVLEVRHHEAV
jgi:transcription elongation factor GreA